MDKSLFINWINKYFQGIVTRVLETINGKEGEAALTYLFREMLVKQYSVTGKWESLSSLNTRVSADYVAMDSSLPLKRRDSIKKATGDIVKSGMELWLNETQLSELDALIAQFGNDPNMRADIIARLFQDAPRVISGIYELLEKSFLEGLSTGVTVIDDSENTGTGIRMDYGYLSENKFAVAALWSNPAAKPLTDIRTTVLNKARADGNTITNVYMDDVTFDNFAKTEEVKNFYAFSVGFVGGAANIPPATVERMNAALRADNRYRFQIAIIDRKVINEKNGVRTTVTPWEEGKVIFTTSPQVGALAWTRLAEQNHPLPNVAYQTADDFILVSMFRENRPSLKEFTTSQARVVPVISNVDKIYQLDVKVVAA